MRHFPSLASFLPSFLIPCLLWERVGVLFFSFMGGPICFLSFLFFFFLFCICVGIKEGGGRGRVLELVVNYITRYLLALLA